MGHGPEERQGQKEGFRWAEKEVGKMAGWAAFLLILLFFLETPSSFLAAFFREKKRRVWKDLQTGYKT
jgi:hypothetical protein